MIERPLNDAHEQTAPGGELRAAAQLLLDLADAVRDDMCTNTYWESELVPPGARYGHGVRNALGGEAGELAALFTPEAAIELAGVFRAWARMVDWDADLLHRIGGEETISLARAITGGTR